MFQAHPYNRRMKFALVLCGLMLTTSPVSGASNHSEAVPHRTLADLEIQRNAIVQVLEELDARVEAVPDRNLDDLQMQRNAIAQVLEDLDARIKVKRGFQSALQNNELTMLILQFAMFRHEAQQNLTATHNLEHLYRHPNMFTHQCVELKGAGTKRFNGLYHRREACNGPPDTCNTLQQWRDKTADHTWYQNHNGCYIYFGKAHGLYGKWICCEEGGFDKWFYYANSAEVFDDSEAVLTTTGPVHWRNHSALYPPPNVQLVSCPTC